MKILASVLSILVVIIFLTVPVFSNMGNNQDTNKDIAIKIAQARVDTVETELSGLIKDCAIVKEEYVASVQMKQANAVSLYEHLEISRKHIKATTDVARMKARLEEARCLLEYTKKTGQIDLTLTSR